MHCTLFEKYICKQETDKCGKVRDCMIVLCDKMKIAKTGATITNYTIFFKILENLIVKCKEEG